MKNITLIIKKILLFVFIYINLLDFAFAKNSSDDFVNPIILETQISKYLLSKDFITYEYKQKIYFPLVEFANLLEIEIREESGQFKITLYDKNIIIDYQNNFAWINKKKVSIDTNDYFFYYDEFQIGEKILEKLFSISFQYNKREQKLKIISSYKFPIEKRAERQVIHKKLYHNSQTKSYRQKKNIVVVPYKFFTLPTFSFDYAGNYKKKPTIKYKDNFKLFSQNDVLFFSNITSLNYVDDKISSLKLSFSRKFYSSNPFVPTGIRFGDILYQNFSLTPNFGFGRGIEVSNLPNYQIIETNKTSIQGYTKPNWEVELYINNVLVDYISADQSGLYSFPEVQLISRENVIDLFFYGPYGQREELRKYYFINSKVIAKKKLYYYISGSQKEKNLIELDKSLPKMHEDRLSTQFKYGLFENLSLVTNYTALSNKDSLTQYLSLGCNSVLGRIYIFANSSLNLDHGSAWEAFLQTKIGKYSLGYKYTQYESNFKNNNNIKSSWQGSMATFINVNPLPKINCSFNLEEKKYDSEHKRVNLENRVSTSYKKLYFSHFIELSKELQKNTLWDNNESLKINANLLFIDRFHKNITLKSKIFYEINPNLIKSTNSSIDFNIDKKTKLHTGINYYFKQENIDAHINYLISIDRKFKLLYTNFRLDYNDRDKNYSGTLGFSFDFGIDTKSKKFLISSERFSKSGIVKITTNYDNIDSEEKIAPSYKVNNSKAKTLMKNSKYSLISNVPTHRPVEIKFDLKSLADPYWTLLNNSYMVITRPGAPLELKFVVLPTGEIEGFVYLQKNGELDGLSNIRLQLYESNNKFFKEVFSSYDGYYLFEKIPFGLYYITVADKELKLKKDRLPVNLNRENEIIYDKNFIIMN